MIKLRCGKDIHLYCADNVRVCKGRTLGKAEVDVLPSCAVQKTFERKLAAAVKEVCLLDQARGGIWVGERFSRGRNIRLLLKMD